MFRRTKEKATEEHPQRHITPRMFWNAVMIVTNHAYFNCREDYDRDPWQFPGMPSFRDSVDLVGHTTASSLTGWA